MVAASGGGACKPLMDASPVPLPLPLLGGLVFAVLFLFKFGLFALLSSLAIAV
jgi:hypothetical protein